MSIIFCLTKYDQLELLSAKNCFYDHVFLAVHSGGFKGHNKGAIHVCFFSWDKIDKN